MSDQQTFVMIKPDAVQRGLIGKILHRIEKRGFKIVAMKFIIPSKTQIQEHFKQHLERPFYQSIEDFLTSGPVCVLVCQGSRVVREVKQLVGSARPTECLPGTVRGDLCLQSSRNLVHASICEEDAAREVGIWFTENEVCKYQKSVDVHIIE